MRSEVTVLDVYGGRTAACMLPQGVATSLLIYFYYACLHPAASEK